MRRIAYLACVLIAGTGPAAAGCPGNENALGTSRVLTVEPSSVVRVGSMQYRHTLPLARREVVLTFDDGPMPGMTAAVLGALAAECVQATFFMVGRQAAAYPALVRKVYIAGHTIGTHSQNHPLSFHWMGTPRVNSEVANGITSVAMALGSRQAVAPYFRIPGLLRSATVEKYLAAHALTVWSADVVADDWHRGIGARAIVRRAMQRLESKGGGILLLHDIQPATVVALPMLLKEMKKRGYRIVHVVPGGARPAIAPALVAAADTGKQGWPRVAKASGQAGTQKPARHASRHHRRADAPANPARNRRPKTEAAVVWWPFSRVQSASIR